MIKNLLDHLEQHKIQLVEAPIPSKSVKALYFDEIIVLDSERIETESEKFCILAEEIGHYETTSGIITDTSDLASVKQENIARRWAYKKLLPLERFIDCFNEGCRNAYEAAEYLGVTVEFLEESVKAYHLIHGDYHIIEDYIIYFNPLGVMKRF